MLHAMKGPFLGLRTVKYGAPDLAAARDWYARVVGFPPYFDQPFYVGFNVGGYELALDPDAKPSSEGVVTYWGVADIDREHARLLELGAKPHEAPKEVGGDIRVASVIDPWGNVIGLIYNPAFKAE
jgi:lactoylglutathione lyase